MAAGIGGDSPLEHKESVMERGTKATLRAAFVLGCWISVGFAAESEEQSPSEQVQRGKFIYSQSCQRCHGVDMYGGPFAPALRGFRFTERWAGQSIGNLFSRMKLTMPPGGGRLPDAEYVALTAYILDAYGLPVTSTPLPIDEVILESMRLPPHRSLELASGTSLPPWPAPVNPAERLTFVTDSMLDDPPNGSWLSWRHTRDSVGFSPLKSITKKNVRHLRVAWTLALASGPNQSTPLVHDGVIFVPSFGDHMQALDASTGEEIWRYSHRISQGFSATVHRNIALYRDKVYAATSDSSVIALDAKTGVLIWEQHLGNELTYTTSGPIVASGVVMLGLGGRSPGGESIVGLDADSGKVLWRFNTIARPEEAGGNSWNGLPLEKRTGGSVWTAGSYDAKSNLVFFGTAPTYDTAPLRDRVSKAGITNDALYTNSTLALDPRTGRLVWYFQHMPNDQWDLDWAFERQVLDLQVEGKTQRVLVTAGKGALYDALTADKGTYLFSIDLGLQNVVVAVDPRSGAKTVNRDLNPGNGKIVTVCPHLAGAKSWTPASYNPTTRILYISLVESCMDLTPVPKGDVGFLSTGVWPELRPRPESDGKYGRLQAVNMETRRPIWSQRQRAPLTTGTLVTAGGVVFAGALDRWFAAYDADTGEGLWRIRLSDVPNAAPISYIANGKQYIAVVVGVYPSSGHAGTYMPFIPEIHMPIAPSSAIWAFELP